MPLSLSIRTVEPDITVVELSGKMTLSPDGPNLEVVVPGLIADGVRKMVIELSNLTYIDSAGMGQIVYSATKVGQAGGRCRIAGAKGLVLEVFHITRIDTVVPFSTNLEEACAALSAA